MTAAVSLNTQTYLGHNQEAYQELRLALQLNLRRQLLLAVCDDIALQEQLAQRLEANFSPLPDTVPLASEVRARQLTLVTLRLRGDRPDLVREVLLWLKQQRQLQGSLPTSPVFQIVGIDQLTRQSPTVQNRFLASLIRVDALLTQLDCRLVVWVPRPWLGKIRQSVPGFWRSRSGLFEFIGEPSPQSPTPPPSPRPSPAPPPKVGKEPAATPDLWRVLQDDLATFEHPTPPSAVEDMPPSATAAVASPQPPSLPRPGTDSAEPQNRPEGRDRQNDSALESGAFSSVIMPPVGATAAAALASLQAELQTGLPAAQPVPAPVEPAPARPAPPALQLPPDLARDAEVTHLWRYIQDLVDQQAGPLTLGRAYLALGQMGRDRLAFEAPAASDLEFAMAVYERAIAGLPEGSADWCDALNDLASLYWLRGQQPGIADPVPWLQRSVKIYEQALQGSPGAISPDTLGRIYGNLGTVHGLLANFDPSDQSLEQSIAAYRQALEYCPAAQSPMDYANLQNSLGAIYWRLAQQGQPQQHLPLAIAAYGEALRYRPAEDAPLEFAMIQNNLGIAYWSLAQHQQAEQLLTQAIAAYQAALTYRTLEAAPASCAATANNLGTAYWDLAQQPAVSGDRRLDTLQQAIAAYETALAAAETALQASPSAPLGFDLWATCHSAGVVHDQLAQALPAAQIETRQQHLQTALHHYLLTYEGWRDSPQQLDVLITALVYNAHLTFEIFGIPGQQAVLAKLPGELLPQVLRRL